MDPAPAAFPEVLFGIVLAGVVAIAAWTDLTARRIPNWLCALTLAAGFAHAGLASGPGESGWPAVGLAALHAGVALMVTMGLFAVRAIGAGDAKFYTAIAAWLPIGQGLWLLVSVALAGLVLLAAFFIARRGRGVHRVRGAESAFDKLPYGVAIGVGGLAAVMLT